MFMCTLWMHLCFCLLCCCCVVSVLLLLFCFCLLVCFLCGLVVFVCCCCFVLLFVVFVFDVCVFVMLFVMYCLNVVEVGLFTKVVICQSCLRVIRVALVCVATHSDCVYRCFHFSVLLVQFEYV